MRTRTLQQILDSARQLADQGGPNDGRNTDASLTYQANQFVAMLWGKLVAVAPDRFLQSYDLSTTAGTKSYDLSAAIPDFMSMRRVARVSSTGQECRIEAFGLAEKSNGNPWAVAPFSPVRYRVWGQGLDGADVSINFEPDPGTSTYRLYYVQAPQNLVDLTDAYDGVAGFENWIEHRLAIWMKERDEEDTSGLRADLAAIEQSIMALAGQRDAGAAPRVQETRQGRWMGRSRGRWY